VQVERFFDLSLLTGPENETPQGIVREGNIPFSAILNINTEDIPEGSGGPATQIKLENPGSSILRYYFIDIEGNPPGPSTPFVDVAPGQTKTKTAEELGILLAGDHPFFTVQNVGPAAGYYKVTIYL
jgi:hypothetical protein